MIGGIPRHGADKKRGRSSGGRVKSPCVGRAAGSGKPRPDEQRAILGALVTTVLFSLAHGSLDPCIPGCCLVLSGALAVTTWRTGGPEVAVMLHAVHDASAVLVATMLRHDLGGALGTRAEIEGSILDLVPSAGIVIITAVIWWTTRRSGPARPPLPAGPPIMSSASLPA